MRVPDLPHTALGGFQAIPTVRAMVTLLPRDAVFFEGLAVVCPPVKAAVSRDLAIFEFAAYGGMISDYAEDSFE